MTEPCRRTFRLAFFSIGIALALIAKPAQAQSSASTLDIVGWNIEYFGAPYNSGPTDKDLQEVNTKRILRMLNADLYGVLEVVDSMRFRRLVDSLGQNEYGFVIAPFCSGNSTGTGASWTSGQKTAFIYRKSIFTNVRTRGIMRNSSTGYTNWASGRFPFLFSATATINGTSKDINVILIHGKSGSAQSDYDKRFGAAQELKDTLDAQFNNTLNLIIGDYNDALNTSIYPGATVSSYTSIISDSTDADSYKSITLPLGVAGQSTMINFPNVIDNHVISNEVVPFYIAGSAKVRTDVTTVIPDYVTAHNTSDHYPVFSQYNLSGAVSAINPISPQVFGLSLFPNPGRTQFWLRSKKNIPASDLLLFNAGGQLIWKGSLPRLSNGSNHALNLANLPAGSYHLEVSNSEGRTRLPFIQLQ